MSIVTKQNEQLEFIFTENKPPIIEMQVENLAGLLTLKNKYPGKNVWVIDIEKIYYLINGLDGSELSHWKQLSFDFTINPYDLNKEYKVGEFTLLNSVLYYSKINNNTSEPNKSNASWVIVGDSLLPELKITGVSSGFGRFAVGDTLPEHENLNARFADAFNVKTPIIFLEPIINFNLIDLQFNFQNVNPNNIGESQINKSFELFNIFKKTKLVEQLKIYNIENLIDPLANDNSVLFDVNQKLVIDNNLDIYQKNELYFWINTEIEKIIDGILLFDSDFDANSKINVASFISNFEFIQNHAGTETSRELFVDNVLFVGTDLTIKVLENKKLKVRINYSSGESLTFNDNLGEAFNSTIVAGYVDSQEIDIFGVMPIFVYNNTNNFSEIADVILQTNINSFSDSINPLTPLTGTKLNFKSPWDYENLKIKQNHTENVTHNMWFLLPFLNNIDFKIIDSENADITEDYDVKSEIVFYNNNVQIYSNKLNSVYTGNENYQKLIIGGFIE